MAQFRTDTKKLDGAHDRTRHEVMLLGDRISPSGTITDAFGRLRISSPVTLFDSFHRYQDNGYWANTAVTGATIIHNTNTSSVALNVTTTSGSKVVRETTRVFAYQPGKSLLVMNTFAMNTPKAGLRQRVGYFGSQNGVYLENDGTGNFLVLRSFISGSVDETRRIPQSEWNVDKFDSTGYAGQVNGGSQGSLDTSKTNIFWMDIEWLGVGDVRCGFVVAGKMIVAHIFHNDNLNVQPYMTTASLPLRYEIENTSATASISTLTQVCSTVIAEGGYTGSGQQYSVSGTPITTWQALGTAGTFTPIISLRLKATRLDAIAIISGLSMIGHSSPAAEIEWRLYVGNTLTGTTPSWESGSPSVEYDISATGITGGINSLSGYISATGSNSPAFTLSRESLFKYQLERNSLTSTPIIITLAGAGSVNAAEIKATMSWEQIV